MSSVDLPEHNILGTDHRDNVGEHVAFHHFGHRRQVRKSGRTTGLTSGDITVLDATISVSYGTGRTATFENQIVTAPISEGGDSGSLVVAAGELKAVGLLFAGSQQSTIVNPIQEVLDCLDVSL